MAKPRAHLTINKNPLSSTENVFTSLEQACWQINKLASQQVRKLQIQILIKKQLNKSESQQVRKPTSQKGRKLKSQQYANQCSNSVMKS